MKLLKNIKDGIRDVFSPVLSDKTILKYNEKGILIEGPLSPSQIQPNSIDLTLGNTWKKLIPNKYIEKKDIFLNENENHTYTYVTCIDTSIPVRYDEGLFQRDPARGVDYYTLMPGEFILMASNEILNIPNGILSFVQGRSSVARLGIQTEQAGLIDAGFRGTITFEVYNQTDQPIILYSGMRIAQVYFFKAQKALNAYGNEKGSKYHGQIEATGSHIHMDPELNKINNEPFFTNSKIK